MTALIYPTLILVLLLANINLSFSSDSRNCVRCGQSKKKPCTGQEKPRDCGKISNGRVANGCMKLTDKNGWTTMDCTLGYKNKVELSKEGCTKHDSGLIKCICRSDVCDFDSMANSGANDTKSESQGMEMDMEIVATTGAPTATTVISTTIEIQATTTEVPMATTTEVPTTTPPITTETPSPTTIPPTTTETPSTISTMTATDIANNNTTTDQPTTATLTLNATTEEPTAIIQEPPIAEPIIATTTEKITTTTGNTSITMGLTEEPNSTTGDPTGISNMGENKTNSSLKTATITVDTTTEFVHTTHKPIILVTRRRRTTTTRNPVPVMSPEEAERIAHARHLEKYGPKKETTPGPNYVIRGKPEQHNREPELSNKYPEENHDNNDNEQNVNYSINMGQSGGDVNHDLVANVDSHTNFDSNHKEVEETTDKYATIVMLDDNGKENSRIVISRVIKS